MKMKKDKVKMKFNEHEFKMEMEQYNVSLPIFNRVLSAYNAMNLPELNLTEFKELFSRVDSIIFRKMTKGEQMNVGGIKISEEKALDLFEKPAGFDNLKEAINQANDFPNLDWFMKFITLEGQTIGLKADLLAKKQEAHTLYATTDDQIKANELAEAILTKTVELFGEKGLNIVEFVQKAFHVDTFGLNANKATIDYKALSTFREAGSHFG
jgi:hypothetical protein